MASFKGQGFKIVDEIYRTEPPLYSRSKQRVLMSLDESEKIPLSRRLSRAARNAWSALRPAQKEKGKTAIGDGWRYACSKREWTREGLRGIPLMLGAPGKFQAR